MHDSTILRYIAPNGEPLTALPVWCTQTDWLITAYQQMQFARLLDQKAIALQRTGQLGTYASILGAEAIDVAVGLCMEPFDILAPYYRNHACQMVRGLPASEILRYWGGDEHGSAAPEMHRDFPNCIPIASQTLHACGAAFALRYRQQSQIAVAMLGDGATSKGDFAEALNVAGVWKLPVVFVINSNQWAISVPRHQQSAASRLSDKGLAAAVPGIQVDGNDIIALRIALDTAFTAARNGEGPFLLEALSYRLSDHTTADDASRYCPADELKQAWQHEPVARLRKLLLHLNLWDEQQEQQLMAELQTQLEQQVAAYLAIQPAPVTDMFDHLYATLPDQLRSQRDWAEVNQMTIDQQQGDEPR
ncbi:pyruvate dehydrogenase (acetyl-transferring) E1 component subunit alpha [Pontibacter sp. JAM-7]|uniref:pyruvate dehydrogenase (acetyl-transferring) E1 component subunit alpha n=1 Tax=Pontibacter sp. JAM-7 TaxID=3366581 RepID=UPI003AF45C21